MYWGLLICAIAFEILGTLALKYSSTNASIWAMFVMVISYITSFVFLWGAVKKLDLSIAYAIWSGVGTAVICISSVYLFKEELGLLKIICIGFIIIGVVGLELLNK